MKVTRMDPMCPTEGLQPFNGKDCSLEYFDCSKSEVTQKLEGHLLKCDEGSLFNSITRKCEQTGESSHCPST